MKNKKRLHNWFFYKGFNASDVKIIIALILAFCLTTVFVGCGNNSIGFGNYTFRHVHYTDNIEGHCGTVETWYDNSAGIELMTSEYGSMFLSEGTYMLFANETYCPYCH